METELTKLAKWLKGSGLKVNEGNYKTCSNNSRRIGNYNKNNNGVLGVLFDSKLQWVQHVAVTIRKANNALSAIKLIKKYFNKKELLSLMTSNFYSRLYYNSEIWLLNTLHGKCKQLLLSASARALKGGTTC